MVPYRCSLIAIDGSPIETIDLEAATDADAILRGSNLMKARPEYAGVEIRDGPRLVYMQKEDQR